MSVINVYTVCPMQLNKGLKVVKDFRLALRRAQHAAIYECFRAFNRKGGAIVPLQTGGTMYFARACILAIYADQPAVRKCTLTGSACPVCYTPEKKMASAVQEPRHSLLRNEKNMNHRKRILTRMSNVRAPGANDRAQKKAKRLGINMDVDNAWTDGDAPVEERPFGPCERLDNVWQNMPQPNLHGFDEGMVCKKNSGVLETTIKEAYQRHGISATKVNNP